MLDSLQQIIDFYNQQAWYITAAEWVVLVFGIWSVWLAKKEHIGVYPVGLVATTLTMWLLFLVEYWGDMLVNLYFSAMSIYGWVVWSRKTNTGTTLQPTYLTSRQKTIGIGLFFLTLALVLGVYRFFGTQLDWAYVIDLISAGLFFTAMYFMALKKIESWILWFIADLIVIPIYLYRELYLLALQYIVFTVLAVQAYRSWKSTAEAALESEN